MNIPCLTAFIAERCLPSRVAGPRLWEPLRRDAARWAAVREGRGEDAGVSGSKNSSSRLEFWNDIFSSKGVLLLVRGLRF